MKFERVLCPICNLDKSIFFTKCDGLNIVKCKNCGLVYVNPRISKDKYKKHFQEEYITFEEKLYREFGIWREPTLKREASIIKKIKPQGGRILDIGCAGGLFLSFFKSDNKWKCYGVELSKFAAEKAREKYGIDVFCGTLNEAGYPDSFFDVVTILDTLPFIPNPIEELLEVWRILKHNGILAVEIPGFYFRMLKNKGIICRLLYGKWVSLNPREHLFYYSDDTLNKLLNKTGFKIVKTYIERPPIYGSKFRKFLHYGYFFLSQLLYWITLKKLNFGAKIFYIAKKIEEKK